MGTTSRKRRIFLFRTNLSRLGATLLLVAINLFVIYPILMLFFTAGKSQADLVQNSFGPPGRIFLQNYLDVWNTEGLPNYLKNSLIVSIGVVLGTVFLSALGGFGLAQLHFRGKKLLRVILVMGLVIPVETLVIPLFYMLKGMGQLNTYMAMIAPQVALGLPFGILLVHSFMVGLPKELFEAAEIDGCNTWNRFRRIAFPLIKPALIGVGIFQFIWSWNQYLLPLVVVQEASLRTVPVMLGYYIGQHGTDFTRLSAAAVILFIPILTFYIIFNRSIMGVRLTGALK